MGTCQNRAPPHTVGFVLVPLFHTLKKHRHTSHCSQGAGCRSTSSGSGPANLSAMQKARGAFQGLLTSTSGDVPRMEYHEKPYTPLAFGFYSTNW